SAEVLGDAALRSRLIPCSPEGEGEACALQLIEELGRRAFRRPLTEEEVGRFQSLFARRGELTASGTFEEAAALIIEAFLSSPSFLMRSEISERADGEVFLLSSYEVASRLSYMLWGSMPDELLFEAAQADELATSEQILVQARRMLADPKARETVRRFHEHYLHMGPGPRRVPGLRRGDGAAPVAGDGALRRARRVRGGGHVPGPAHGSRGLRQRHPGAPLRPGSGELRRGAGPGRPRPGDAVRSLHPARVPRVPLPLRSLFADPARRLHPKGRPVHADRRTSAGRR